MSDVPVAGGRDGLALGEVEVGYCDVGAEDPCELWFVGEVDELEEDEMNPAFAGEST